MRKVYHVAARVGGDAVDLYEPIKTIDANDIRSIPIYLGRSVSQGARKGKKKFNDPPGPVLYNRILSDAEFEAEKARILAS